MPSIGETLREARLSRGLTYEYVSQIIKIRPEFLEALEDGDYAALPGSFYARNFLRRYADFLGLDSTELVDRFAREEEAAGAADQTPALNPVRSTGVTRHWSPNLGVIAALALLGVAATVLAYNMLFSPRTTSIGSTITPTPTGFKVAMRPSPTASAPTTRRSSPATVPTQTSSPTLIPASSTEAAPTPSPTARKRRRHTSQRTVTPANTSTSTDTPRPTSAPKPTAVTGAVVASIRATAPANVTVKSDGRIVFQGVLRPGRIRQFGAEANLYVWSNNAPHTFVSVNKCAGRSLDRYACPGCLVAYYNFPRTYHDCR